MKRYPSSTAKGAFVFYVCRALAGGLWYAWELFDKRQTILTVPPEVHWRARRSVFPVRYASNRVMLHGTFDFGWNWRRPGLNYGGDCSFNEWRMAVLLTCSGASPMNLVVEYPPAAGCGVVQFEDILKVRL